MKQRINDGRVAANGAGETGRTGAAALTELQFIIEGRRVFDRRHAVFDFHDHALDKPALVLVSNSTMRRGSRGWHQLVGYAVDGAAEVKVSRVVLVLVVCLICACHLLSSPPDNGRHAVCILVLRSRRRPQLLQLSLGAAPPRALRSQSFTQRIHVPSVAAVAVVIDTKGFAIRPLLYPRRASPR